MTKEEREKAIDLLDNMRGMIEDNQGNDYDFALKKGIEALKQEPCEDAVSKASVFEILGNLMGIPYEFDRRITEKDVSESMDEIRNLPSVTPTHKKGKWIKVTNGRGGHECNICHNYAPSFQNGDEHLTKYCPHCGAEMQEVEHE
jgi:hypothetical protein